MSNLTSKRVRLDSNKLKEKTFNFVAELKTNTEKLTDNIKQQEKNNTQECNFQNNNTNNKTNWADEKKALKPLPQTRTTHELSIPSSQTSKPQSTQRGNQLAENKQ
ncbi:29573_t:CDS:2, partial [Racocetra persica]